MKTHDYKADLINRLTDTAYAVGYLNACMNDKNTGVFLLALRDVVEAHGGFKAFSSKTGLNREHLFRMLSKTGNPNFSNVQRILHVTGIQIQFVPLKKAHARSKRALAA